MSSQGSVARPTLKLSNWLAISAVFWVLIVHAVQALVRTPGPAQWIASMLTVKLGFTLATMFLAMAILADGAPQPRRLYGWMPRLLIILAALMATLALWEHVSGISLAIDFASAGATAQFSLGRMSTTAAEILLVALSLSLAARAD